MHRPALAAALALALSAAPLALATAQPAMPPPSTDPAQLPAGHYANDPNHSAMILRVQHMGMTHSTFRMNKVEASFDYDPAKADASKVTATIDANSFDQGTAAISAQFAKEFLDAPNHPQITFVSTSLKRTDATHGVLTGDLTIGGVTKPTSLNVTFDGFRPAGGFGPLRTGFSATGHIVRADWGIGKQMPTAAVGDVDVILEMEFTKAS
jgi:polyisoprenoid-binding protein YceI